MENQIATNSFDQLFAEAAYLVIDNQIGSASLLQRKLKIGYNRAGKIMDELVNAGIVGPFNGSDGRDILIEDHKSLYEFLQGRLDSNSRIKTVPHAQRICKSIFPDSRRIEISK